MKSFKESYDEINNRVMSQQYWIKNPNDLEVKLGGAIFESDESDIMIGFVSDKKDSLIQITLFDKINISTLDYESYITEDINWEPLFRNLLEEDRDLAEFYKDLTDDIFGKE